MPNVMEYSPNQFSRLRLIAMSLVKETMKLGRERQLTNTLLQGI